MKRIILIFSIITVIFFVSSCSEKSESDYDLKNSLDQFVSIQEATLLQPEETDEFWAVTEKVTQAMGENSEWFMEFRQENKYYPYIYDENLGITEKEYNNLFINGEYITLNEGDPYVFSCETYDDNIYSMYFPEMELSFTVNVEQNSLTLGDGTALSFAKSVDLDESDNLLGDWVGSTYSYMNAQSNETNLELYDLGIHDEVFDIGHENYIAPLQAVIAGELECRFVSITLGKYKGLDEYVIYYRHFNSVEGISDYYIFKLT